MLNNRQKILLELCCACISSGKFSLRDLWDSVDSDYSYLNRITDRIQDAEDAEDEEEDEEYLDEEDEKPIIQEKPITNYSY